MKSGFLGTVAMFFLGAGWATAQVSAPAPTTTPAPMAAGVVMPSAMPIQQGVPNSGPPIISSDAVTGNGGGPLWYANAEYLLWKVQNGRLPSTSTVIPVGLIAVDITNSSTPDRTIPGTPDAQRVTGYAPVTITSNAGFGAGPRTDTGYQNGGRFNLGFWADPDMSIGMEVSAFYLPRTTDNFAAITGQSPGQFILDTGFTQTLFLVTPPVPPATSGTTTPLSTTQVFVTRQATSSLSGSASNSLYGGELNVRTTSLRFGGIDVGGLAGFRYLCFQDDLSLNNNVRLSQPPGIPPTSTDLTASLSRDLTFSSTDHTRVWNYFYGGQVGVDLDAKFGSFFIYARGKLGLGTNHQVADVNSNTVVINNDLAHLSPPSLATGGGLLGGPADNGRHSRDVLAFIPEATVNVGYQFTNWLRGYVGYNGLYLNSFARSGDSNTINTLNTSVMVANNNVNVNVAQPTFRFHDTNIWVQGVTFGLQMQY